MIAWFQRALVATWLLAVVGLLIHLTIRGPTVATMAWLFVLTFGHPMVLAVEFAMMVFVNRHEPVAKPRVREVISAWFLECLHALKVFAWWQPFRSRAQPDVKPRRPSALRGVVLVHGLVCNRGLWHDWLVRLRSLEVPAIAVDLEPPWGPIETYVDTIERAVARIESLTGLPPVIVAHSMGGLAARCWWRTSAASRVHRLITLGTPHHGTVLARLGLSPNVCQMRDGSAWLRNLATSEGSEHLARMTCFFSVCDNIVFPATCATMPGADNRQLVGTAHVHMVSHPEPWTETLKHLDPLAGRPAAGSGASTPPSARAV